MGLTNFFDKKILKKAKVRFWTEKEWLELTPKERLWIFYKHHWTMKNQGSGEVDQITTPIQQLLILGGIIYSAITAFLLASKVSFDPVGLGYTVFIFGAIYFVGMTVFQWFVGNWKDKQDLIALEQEIQNRRNNVFREMRNGKLSYKYTKKGV